MNLLSNEPYTETGAMYLRRRRFVILHRTVRFVLGAAALAAVVALNSAPGKAFPPFVQKEGKPCGYCHVAAEGKGPRNYRGMYYKAHNLSFMEFDDAAEAKKAGVPLSPDPDPKVMPKTWTAPKAAPMGEEKAMSVADAKAKVKTTEAAYKKKMTDPAAKKAYASALADLGHSTMLDQSIPPKKRYPDALKLYKQALVLDPTNKTALDDKKQIEDVYKSMGRPIP